MLETTAIDRGLLATLSFMSGVLGHYDTFSDSMVTWSGKGRDFWFAALCWDDDDLYVEIADGVDPKLNRLVARNAAYTIFGYCRYHGISHKLRGAILPAFKESKDD
jgi:hypothetical protein|tara:strand:+ start:1094 stop:1411 length:318 start_codon:yes stop_codon:yes gene_type:complete